MRINLLEFKRARSFTAQNKNLSNKQFKQETRYDTFESSKNENMSYEKRPPKLSKEYERLIEGVLQRINPVFVEEAFYSNKICIKSQINLSLCEKYLKSDNFPEPLSQEKIDLILGVVKNIELSEKTEQGVTLEYIKNFVNTLAKCHPVLLKNVVDNNIPIEIRDDICLYEGFGNALFRQGFAYANEFDEYGFPDLKLNKDMKTFIFSERFYDNPIIIDGKIQNTYKSLPHELSHAFDHYNGTELGLTPQDFLTVDFEKHDANKRFLPLASCSKEFDEAIKKDIILMSEKDMQNGKEFGSTFNSLLKNRNFIYYLGVIPDEEDKVEETGFNDIEARKELFAQMMSYVSSGYVTNEEFNNRIEELFPNCLNFAKEVLDKAQNL